MIVVTVVFQVSFNSHEQRIFVVVLFLFFSFDDLSPQNALL